VLHLSAEYSSVVLHLGPGTSLLSLLSQVDGCLKIVNEVIVDALVRIDDEHDKIQGRLTPVRPHFNRSLTPFQPQFNADCRHFPYMDISVISTFD